MTTRYLIGILLAPEANHAVKGAIDEGDLEEQDRDAAALDRALSALPHIQR